jgi:hypothetical protein
MLDKIKLMSKKEIRSVLLAKMKEISAEETKEKYPSLEKLCNAINQRRVRYTDEFFDDLDKSVDYIMMCSEIPEDFQLELEKQIDNYNHSVYTDFICLPNYGGEEPEEIAWSYDKDNLMVNDETPFKVVPRRALEED